MSKMSPKKEFDKLVSESGSIGTYVTRFGDLLHGIEFSLGVILAGNGCTYNRYGG